MHQFQFSKFSCLVSSQKKKKHNFKDLDPIRSKVNFLSLPSINFFYVIEL